LFIADIILHIAPRREAVLVLAAVPLIYYLLASLATLRFFHRERSRKWPEFTPPVSVLKTVRGVDFGSYENFASFCRQDYPDYEILFAVNDDSDPAVPLIRRIMVDYPARKIRLLTDAAPVGTSQKTNNLVLLAKEAKNEILVLSDGDVRVGPRYLREVVAPLADNRNGAVTCLYRAVAQPNFYAELEAVGSASDFSAGVLMAAFTEGVRFALGASISTTKQWLRKIGGFESFASMLADDYELGNRVSRAGGRVVLSSEVVWTMYPAQTPRGFWEHQVRWARTVRHCRPASYLGLVFTQGLPWAVLAAAAAPTKAIALGYLAAYLVLRSAMAWTVGVWGLRDEVLRKRLWLVPLRDAIHFFVWLASFASNRVTWGDSQYEMEKGQMVPVR
jgi:ceramide glucosyltransferase